MRILHQNIGAIAAALVIVIMLDPTTRAQDNIPRSSSAISAAAQPGHSPANAPNEVNEMPTSPPFGAPAGSTAELPQDLSVWGMFLHADRVVKAVMIGLALASLATWAIWLAKALELRRARSEVQKDLRLLANCSTLSEAHEQFVHEDHFHVRLACPTDSAECKAQPLPPANEGCGYELDYWIKKAQLVPKEPPAAQPPKHPTTLAGMPPTCREVVKAP
jgi:Penicillin-insensitive murein endopeptidase